LQRKFYNREKECSCVRTGGEPLLLLLMLLLLLLGGWAMGEKDQSLGMLAQSGSGGTDKKDSTPSLFENGKFVEQTCPWRRDTGETPKKKFKIFNRQK
jgi:hypothetical protein